MRNLMTAGDLSWSRCGLLLTFSLMACGNLSAQAPAAVKVAAELKAKGEALDPAKDALVFQGPDGDGRSGAKGILLMDAVVAKAAVEKGSTWMFRYRRSKSARTLQIFHPVGRGHVIAHVTADELGLSAPKEGWKEVGYSGGDKERIRTTPAYDKIFPLADDTDYVVVSRLSVGGSYELFINGKLVATGRGSNPPQMDLNIPADVIVPSGGRNHSEFKSAGLAGIPLKWSPGWSAVLVGPIDSGENTCRDLLFYPAVVDVGGAKR